MKREEKKQQHHETMMIDINRAMKDLHELFKIHNIIGGVDHDTKKSVKKFLITQLAKQNHKPVVIAQVLNMSYNAVSKCLNRVKRRDSTVKIPVTKVPKIKAPVFPKAKKSEKEINQLLNDIESICGFYGMDFNDVKKEHRGTNVFTKVKMFICYRAIKELGFTLESTAEYINKKKSSCEALLKKFLEDPELMEEYRDILN